MPPVCSRCRATVLPPGSGVSEIGGGGRAAGETPVRELVTVIRRVNDVGQAVYLGVCVLMTTGP
jgi:hypothetical protein